MAIELTVTHRAPTTAQRMADVAHRSLDSLNEQQRRAASFPFAGDERYRWDYRPTTRNGLRLINMTAAQRLLAFELLRAGLSDRGLHQVTEIIALEPILREHERIDQRVVPWVRDPELYRFSVFGEPGGAAPWAWRVGGHHLGAHFTIVDRALLAAVPLFFGANPAEVRHGPETGKRTLREEEDWARELVRALSPEQRQQAIVDSVAPRDISSNNSIRVHPGLPPRGLRFSAMDSQHREQLVKLIRHYVERTNPEVAANEWQRIERAGLEPISFAWAGGLERRQGHYYAIVGPTFLIEYDNTQNGANHIHSVWRDFTNDWGEDLLAAHYAESHHH
jgi:hypothetical protein